MDLRDNQMQRGLTQALYKYLPGTWMGFYKRNDRSSVTAYVINWNSSRLENINEERLFQRVNNRVQDFADKGKIRNFDLPIAKANYEVLCPKSGINADIIAEVSPLTFYCSRCHRVHSYRTSQALHKHNPKMRCQESGCTGYLRQINLVYACSCGWAGPMVPKSCKSEPRGEGTKYLRYYGDFYFVCDKHKNNRLEMIEYCPDCKSRLMPKNYLDFGNFIAHSVPMIDLIDNRMEAFLKNEKSSRIVLGVWLGLITREDFLQLVSKGISDSEDEDFRQKINVNARILMEELGISWEKAVSIAQKQHKSTNPNIKAEEVVNKVNTMVVWQDPAHLEDLSAQILEYFEVFYAKDKCTVDDAILTAKKLNTSAKSEKYWDIVRHFGFSNIQASADVPFINCSYGFTRKDNNPAVSTLVGFPPESQKRVVYASKLQTEGILVELDRTQVIKWMIKNRMIDPLEDNLPEDLNDKLAIRAWFLNAIDCRAIGNFSDIDPDKKITSIVYKLIHAICHAMIREAAQLCGLDKNSLSEYIFPNIPAFFIYCQNSQGFHIGALSNLFQAYLDRWLLTSSTSIQKCIFDPVCLDRDRACAGCVYLSEVSCVHFNKDLDRRYLVGWYDRSTDEEIIGFWEDSFNG